MKILLHSLNYAPEELGCGKYSGEMIRELAAAGHRCVVVTTPPYYPQWRVWEGYRSKWYSRQFDQVDRYETAPGQAPSSHAIEVVRCPLWAPQKVSGLRRILHLASFGLSSVPAVLWKAVRFRPDVVMTVEPTAFCMPTTWLAARLTGAKAWLHVQDFEVDAAFDLGILKSKTLRRAVLAAEALLMKRFDRVSTISPNMLKRLRQKGVSERRSLLFPNWVDCDEMKPLWEAAPAPADGDDESGEGVAVANCQSSRRRFGIPEDAFVALYAGSIGDKQGLEILAEAARLLRDQLGRPIRIVVCGDGSGHARLLELSKGQGVSKQLGVLQMLPVQPFESFNELMNCADVHLLPQKAGAADLVMPSKLTGMLATGRPVVACAAEGTQIASVVRDCGIVVPPGEAAPFADAISALAADPARCRRLGAAARQYALQNLNRQGILERFQRELEALVAQAPRETVVAPDNSVATIPSIQPPHFGAAEAAATAGRESNHSR